MNIQRSHSTWAALAAMLFLWSCSGAPEDGLAQTIALFKDTPEYSIVLEDMKQDGNFVKTPYQQYRVYFLQDLPGEEPKFRTHETGWIQVSEETYKKYEGALGMTIAMKTSKGEESTTPQPTGYQYVGNPQYGQWRTNSSGDSFWEFYGKYAFISSVFDVFESPFKRKYYNNYHNNYYKNRVPYYGRNKQYGTAGSYTRKTKPNFYQRAQTREARSKTKFRDKVAKRTYGRSVTRSSTSTTSKSRSSSSRTSRSRMSSSRSRSFSSGGK